MKRTKLNTNLDDELSLNRSSVYQEFLAEREEILKHKWLESEKAGHDIGYERALLDWIINHREKWRSAHRRKRA
ncbi:putative uncharacterized protein [Coraliomargarita sp. CAG:312]|jgi:hypothetical protein|nr:putative uncharacterized protein [Coraliomargarita sp. CAG:312]